MGFPESDKNRSDFITHSPTQATETDEFMHHIMG